MDKRGMFVEIKKVHFLGIYEKEKPNDIAIVETERNILWWEPYVMPACLPLLSDARQVYEGVLMVR